MQGTQQLILKGSNMNSPVRSAGLVRKNVKRPCRGGTTI